MGALKVKMRSGSNEIEVEGTKDEVDELLKSWWARIETRQDAPFAPHPKDSKRAKRKAAGRSGSETAESANSFDQITIANAIKEHERFGLYEERVLHKKDMYNKIALVCLHTEQPVTSGQVSKVLAALDIKADQGHVSNTIKSNSGRFIATGVRKKGGAIPRYKLTSKARTEFEAWLNEVR